MIKYTLKSKTVILKICSYVYNIKYDIGVQIKDENNYNNMLKCTLHWV